MARLKSVAQQIQIAAQATAEATHKALVARAKAEHAKVMVTAPKPSGFERFVDGRQGQPEEAVSPFGVITYLYSHYEEIVEFAIETLRAGSPVDSGDYRNAHTLYVNGVPAADLSNYAGQGEIFIANPLPYSRVIELGKMKMKVSGTDHVFEKAARKVAARFGNLAAVKFTYRSIQDGVHVPYVGRGRTGRTAGIKGAGGKFVGSRSLGKRTAADIAEQDTRAPALLIRPL